MAKCIRYVNAAILMQRREKNMGRNENAARRKTKAS